ncbi:serine/threonine protein kinase [Streptosporangium sp. NBC_01755]|uniref:serine/threonine-protein kinase n=1 Tax=Streptosporangium sp. NBC_01755 TaxID=2975949 RepID=UPI002DD8C04F|nr:serine/threonine-protein kinase [Streptosporangium sp. NBC_01755]WSD02608.1 serine/threonine protein kinase [Streptosporangium sp. NBC_01755]
MISYPVDRSNRESVPVARSELTSSDPKRIGSYRLLARLGAGGMGTVYLGRTKNGRAAAIKVVRSDLANDASFLARFRREAKTLLLIGGSFTSRVIEMNLEASPPYLVTEYVDGPSLSDHVAQEGPLNSESTRALAVGLADALRSIHATGVVHRDLKPSNILLSTAGPKVIDFGIAQTLDATSITRTGVVVGSAGYMAPEQFEGQGGPPADIFAWACTVMFAATGNPPFGSGPLEAVVFRLRNEAPALDGLPEGLQLVVGAALKKDPAERPTADQLMTLLIPESETSAARTTELTLSLLAESWTVSIPEPESEQGRRGNRTWLVGGITAAVVASVGVSILLYETPRTGDDEANAGTRGAPSAAPTHSALVAMSASPSKSSASNAKPGTPLEIADAALAVAEAMGTAQFSLKSSGWDEMWFEAQGELAFHPPAATRYRMDLTYFGDNEGAQSVANVTLVGNRGFDTASENPTDADINGGIADRNLPEPFMTARRVRWASSPYVIQALAAASSNMKKTTIGGQIFLKGSAPMSKMAKSATVGPFYKFLAAFSKERSIKFTIIVDQNLAPSRVIQSIPVFDSVVIPVTTTYSDWGMPSEPKIP